MCVHVKARRQWDVFLYFSLHEFFCGRVFLYLVLTTSVGQAGASGLFLSPTPTSRITGVCYHAWVFMWMLEIQTLVLLLCSKLSAKPQPFYFLLFTFILRVTKGKRKGRGRKCNLKHVYGGQRSEDSLQGSVLSLHHEGIGDPPQVLRVGSTCLYLLRHFLSL